MLARPHPLHPWGGFLMLEPNDWRRCMEVSLHERDRHLRDHPHHVGHAPAFAAWCREVQLPALARKGFYAKQIAARIEHRRVDLKRLEAEVAAGHAYRAGEIETINAEIRDLEALLNG